jgi:hypothetical protein
MSLPFCTPEESEVPPMPLNFRDLCVEGLPGVVVEFDGKAPLSVCFAQALDSHMFRSEVRMALYEATGVLHAFIGHVESAGMVTLRVRRIGCRA